MSTCPTCGRAGYPGPVPAEPPVGTWVRDRYGALSMRKEAGWAAVGCEPFGLWSAMWQARGPYEICGPWGTPLKAEHGLHILEPDEGEQVVILRLPLSVARAVRDCAYRYATPAEFGIDQSTYDEINHQLQEQVKP